MGIASFETEAWGGCWERTSSSSAEASDTVKKGAEAGVGSSPAPSSARQALSLPPRVTGDLQGSIPGRWPGAEGWSRWRELETDQNAHSDCGAGWLSQGPTGM